MVEEMAAIGVNVTRQTVTITLRKEGLHRHRARKTPLLKKKHLYARKQSATEMLYKEGKQFDNALWLDETKINSFVNFGNNYNHIVWRELNSPYKTKNTTPTVRSGVAFHPLAQEVFTS